MIFYIEIIVFHILVRNALKSSPTFQFLVLRFQTDLKEVIFMINLHATLMNKLFHLEWLVVNFIVEDSNSRWSNFGQMIYIADIMPWKFWEIHRNPPNRFMINFPHSENAILFGNTKRHLVFYLGIHLFFVQKMDRVGFL